MEIKAQCAHSAHTHTPTRQLPVSRVSCRSSLYYFQSPSDALNVLNATTLESNITLLCIYRDINNCIVCIATRIIIPNTKSIECEIRSEMEMFQNVVHTICVNESAHDVNSTIDVSHTKLLLLHHTLTREKEEKHCVSSTFRMVIVFHFFPSLPRTTKLLCRFSALNGPIVPSTHNKSFLSAQRRIKWRIYNLRQTECSYAISIVGSVLRSLKGQNTFERVLEK